MNSPTRLENFFNRINDCKVFWSGFSEFRPAPNELWPLRAMVIFTLINAPLVAGVVYLPYSHMGFPEALCWFAALCVVFMTVGSQFVSARYWNRRAARLVPVPQPKAKVKIGFLKKLAYVLFSVLIVGFPLVWFYLNVGGISAWAVVKAATEAKGQSLNYEDFIPKAVPDDQNALAAPGIAEVFVTPPEKPFWSDFSELLAAANSRAKDAPKVGTVTFVIDPSAPEGYPRSLASNALAQAVGAAWPASEKVEVLKLHLSPKNAAPLPPLSVSLKLKTAPAAEVFQTPLPTTAAIPFGFELRKTSTEGIYDLHLASSSLVFADEFLAWSKRLDPLFEKVRAAAPRPHAYLKGNYHGPATAPIPKFTPIRTLARLTEQSALLHLRQGDPDSALRDLENLAAIRRMIASPDFTLVASMIDIVLAEQSLNLIREGFARQAWKKEHLETLAAQRYPLITNLHRTFQAEGCCLVFTADYLMGQSSAQKTDQRDTWTSLKVGAIKLLFQGWLDHNRAVGTGLFQTVIDSVNSPASQISPTKVASANRDVEAFGNQAGLRDALAAMMIPATNRVLQYTARAQTQAHLATLALALERHRLDTGTFPEKLDSLVPKYLPKLPVQVVNGAPFLYRREADGSLLIWSVGWDLKDDNGNTGASPKLDDKSPDWAWKLTKP